MKTSDKIMTFVAIFISCLALVVSIVQTRILQKQSHAAVWPRIGVLHSYGPEHYKVAVVNQGVGPAIISAIEYQYEDTTLTRLVGLVKHILREDTKKQNLKESPSIKLGYAEILKGRVIKPSESIEIYEAKDSLTVRLASEYFDNMDIKIDYCSIYETCWSFKDDEILELD